MNRIAVKSALSAGKSVTLKLRMRGFDGWETERTIQTLTVPAGGEIPVAIAPASFALQPFGSTAEARLVLEFLNGDRTIREESAPLHVTFSKDSSVVYYSTDTSAATVSLAAMHMSEADGLPLPGDLLRERDEIDTRPAAVRQEIAMRIVQAAIEPRGRYKTSDGFVSIEEAVRNGNPDAPAGIPATTRGATTTLLPQNWISPLDGEFNVVGDCPTGLTDTRGNCITDPNFPKKLECFSWDIKSFRDNNQGEKFLRTNDSRGGLWNRQQARYARFTNVLFAYDPATKRLSGDGIRASSDHFSTLGCGWMPYGLDTTGQRAYGLTILNSNEVRRNPDPYYDHFDLTIGEQPIIVANKNVSDALVVHRLVENPNDPVMTYTVGAESPQTRSAAVAGQVLFQLGSALDEAMRRDRTRLSGPKTIGLFSQTPCDTADSVVRSCTDPTPVRSDACNHPRLPEIYFGISAKFETCAGGEKKMIAPAEWETGELAEEYHTTRDKFVIAHEVGHAIERIVAGTPEPEPGQSADAAAIANNAGYGGDNLDAEKDICACRQVTLARPTHCLQGKGRQMTARQEGWAHFVATATFNDRAPEGGSFPQTFVYYKEFLQTNGAISNFPYPVNLGTPPKWMETNCNETMAGRGTEYDWAAWFWRAYRQNSDRPQYAFADWNDIFRGACVTAGACLQTNVYERYDAAAKAKFGTNDPKYTKTFLQTAGEAGVGHP